VLDLGCGAGELLQRLKREKQVHARGVEIESDNIIRCIERGLAVIQGDLDEGLAEFGNLTYDWVILSQTLQVVHKPALVLREMLRVGRRAIVSFPNWGYWRCRLHLLLTGCIPQAPDLSQRWHDVPRWQALTITDFAHFCQQEGLVITGELYVVHGRRVHIVKVKNLLATTAIFALERRSPAST